MPEPTRRRALKVTAATGMAAAAVAAPAPLPVRGAAASPHRRLYRVLFGTDWPANCAREVTLNTAGRDPGLDRRAHRAIARNNNALRLLSPVAQ